VLVVDDGERLAPVALPAEQPVAQPVRRGARARAALGQPVDDARLGVRDGQPVQADLVVGRVDDRAVAGPGALVALGRLDGVHDGQAERLGERVVAGVAARHGHDRAGAVAHEDVVRDEHRQRGAVHRVQGVAAGEHAGLAAGVGLPLHGGLGRGLAPVGGDGLGGRRRSPAPALRHLVVPRRLGTRDDRVHQGVLGRQHHVRRPEQGVGAGGEDGQRLVGVGDLEVDVRALGTADPVPLHRGDLLRPVDQRQVVGQPVGVGGDPHVPLPQGALEHREVAALGAALGGDLLVRQHRAQTGAPVHRGLGDVRQPLGVDDATPLHLVEVRPGGVLRHPVDPGRHRASAGRVRLDQRRHGARRARPAVGADGVLVVPGPEDLQEDPLRPAHVVRVDRREGPPGVVRDAEPAQLARHDLDVRLGGGARVRARLHGELLGRQAERVVAQGVQDVVALHPAEPRDDVGRDVAQRVPDVQARARRVREHVHHEERPRARAGDGTLAVGQGAGRVRREERAPLDPPLLPPQLDLLGELGGVPERHVLAGAGGRGGCGLRGGGRRHPGSRSRRAPAFRPPAAARPGPAARPAGRRAAPRALRPRDAARASPRR